jgi:hypothetical protein
VAVPIAAIRPIPGEPLQAFITLRHGDEESGRWPVDSPMELQYLGESLELDNWLI